MVALDQSTIKKNNRNRILKLLLRERNLTKLDISRTLNISIPTVTTIVSELIGEEIVEETGTVSSTSGRKPKIINIIPESRYSIGVELKPNYIRAVITDLDCKIKADMKKEYSKLKNDELVHSIQELIEELMALNPYINNKLLGIGFSLPGTIDSNELNLKFAPNFKLKNLSFKKIMDYFNVPIYLENEANAGALSEYTLGIAKGLQSLIYISITEGIGGGIIINKSMYKGASLKAGEIGHMTINKHGRQCNCGKKGCFETYASINALIRDYNEKSDEEVTSLDEIMINYNNNKKTAIDVIDNYMQNLCEGIQNLAFIFNPDYIVIGGDISDYREVFLKKIRENIFKNNELYSKDDVKILFSALGKDANIVGAALISIIESFEFDKIK